MRLNEKGFSLVEGLLVVLIAVVVGFGVVYVINESDNDESVASQEDASEEVAEESSESSTTDEEQSSEATESSGTTYTDEAGFSFTYPEDWFISTDSSTGYQGARTAIVLTNEDRQSAYDAYVASQVQKCCVEDHELAVFVWPSINAQGAQGGTSILLDDNYPDLLSYLSAEGAIKRLVDTLEVNGNEVYEVSLQGHSQRFGVMFELESGEVVEFSFAPTYDRASASQEILDIIDTIEF